MTPSAFAVGVLNGGGGNSSSGSSSGSGNSGATEYLNFITLEDGTISVQGKMPNVAIRLGSNGVISSFSASMGDLTEPKNLMDSCSALSEFHSDLTKITNGYYMFYECSNLEVLDVKSLSNLDNGNYMFYKCSNLEVLDVKNLSNLDNGNYMFYKCTKLKEFNYDMPNLTKAEQMFWGCYALETFNGDLSSLTIGGYQMFYNCKNLKVVNAVLSKLQYSNQMFSGCVLLSSFRANLSSFTNGNGFFGTTTSNCSKLDLPSVQHIADTINDLASQGKTGPITIGISKTIQGNPELDAALATIRGKGWTVTEIYA